MPTYEYKCKSCEELFEIFQKITDAPLSECPVCGGQLKKIISGGAGIIFKGSGFYTTDYKNSSSTSGIKNDTKKESKNEKSTSSKDKENTSSSHSKEKKEDSIKT
jgi:putative FmdB family regulatory protein